jgi:hypothetical protein
MFQDCQRRRSLLAAPLIFMLKKAILWATKIAQSIVTGFSKGTTLVAMTRKA